MGDDDEVVANRSLPWLVVSNASHFFSISYFFICMLMSLRTSPLGKQGLVTGNLWKCPSRPSSVSKLQSQ